MSSKKRGLTAAETEACRRLRALWDQKAKQLGLTQDVAGEFLGSTQGGVGHYLNARNAIGFEAMFRWAQLLKVHPYEIDPSFRDRLPDDLKLAVDNMLVAPGEKAATAYKTMTTMALQLHQDRASWSQTKS